MKVFNDLRTRGVTDMLIAVTDGLKGMPEALSTVFPATTLQTPDEVRGRLCIVHLIRNSLASCVRKDHKAVLPVNQDDLRTDPERRPAASA